MVEVVAALIFREGKFLICQRPAHKARGLLWEFVGGKVEAGESKQQALVRECREELGITVVAGKTFMEVVHKYPDIEVKLTVFEAEIAEGEPQLLEHAAIKWITPTEIKNYDFCPADKDILKKIVKERSADGGHNKKLGGAGESKAARYLKRHGYKILERNYRTPFCEVDIIARYGYTLVFCEVKARLSDAYGAPREAVTPAKQQLYVRAAEHYPLSRSGNYTVRFDVIEVFKGKIIHIESAFES